MKYKVWLLMAAVFTLAWSCVSSDDDNDENGLTGTSMFQASQQPLWQVDMNDSQQRPQWTAPDPSQYENKMIVMVRLQEGLVPFSTDDDLMAVLVDNK